MKLLDLPTKTLRWTAKFAPPTPIIRSFIRPHHIHAPLNVITMPNHLIECPPVFYPPRISPERCAISIKYHKYCHKNPFTSQKLPLNTPAPRLRHQILKTIYLTDKYGLGEAGRIPAGLWEDGGILPEPWISTSFCIVETATSMAITKSMCSIGAKENASRHPYI